MFNFMPSPEMMAKLGIGTGQPSPDMGGGGNGMGGGLLSILQNPSFLQNIMGQRNSGPMGPPTGMEGMRRTMPMGPRMQAPGGEAGGGSVMPGKGMNSGPQKPGMMSRFGNAAMSAAPMFAGMLNEDEDKKKAMLYR